MASWSAPEKVRVLRALACGAHFLLGVRPLPDFIRSRREKTIFLHGREIKSGSGLGTIRENYLLLHPKRTRVI